jgi:ABC-type branched-subunit amino acid transport system substrate-binding protein
MKKNFRTSMVIAVILTIVCFFSLAWGAKPIKIGVPLPLSGPYAHDGLIGKQSVIFATEDINAKGGVLGRKLELHYYDVEDVMPEKVMASAQDLVMGKGVDLVVTSWVDYGVDVKAYGRFDVPYFAGAASSLSIEAYQENPKKYWNFFQYFSTEEEYSRQGWAKMMTIPYTYPNKKVYIINEDDHWSHVIADEYEMLAKKDGWEIVGKDTVSVGNVEWGGILTKIRSTNPAIIMMITLSPTAEAAFLTQFHKAPTQSLIHMPYCPSAPEFIQLGGKYAEGVLWNTLLGILPGPEADAFKEKFIKRFGAETWGISYPAGIWDMMHFWVDAVNKVGKVDDYKAIADYLSKTPYKGLCGTYVYPEKTNTIISGDEYIPAPFFQVQNGKDVQLYPKNWKQGDFIVPSWIKQ